jgi:hypothetical protein
MDKIVEGYKVGLPIALSGCALPIFAGKRVDHVRCRRKEELNDTRKGFTYYSDLWRNVHPSIPSVNQALITAHVKQLRRWRVVHPRYVEGAGQWIEPRVSVGGRCPFHSMWRVLPAVITGRSINQQPPFQSLGFFFLKLKQVKFNQNFRTIYQEI